MTVFVRRAAAADAPLVATLNLDVQAVHAAAFPKRFKAPGPNSSSELEFAALLAKPENLIFIALIGDEPAGYVYAEVIRRPETALTYAYDMVHVHHVSVAARYRRRGVGTALLERVRLAAKDVGIDLLTLEVWSFNETARSFFRRNGFDRYIERLWHRSRPSN